MKGIFRVLKVAWYLYRLEIAADGDFAVVWRSGLNKWEVGYAGDLYSRWVQGSSLKNTLKYFLNKKIK